MNKSLFTPAFYENIDVVDRGINDLRRLGATLVDPGPEGALFQPCIDKYAPPLAQRALHQEISRFFSGDGCQRPARRPNLAAAGHVLQSFAGPQRRHHSRFRSRAGDRRRQITWLDRYLRARGDQNIKSTADLIAKAKFYGGIPNTRFIDAKATLEARERAMTFDMRERALEIFSIQQIVLQCMAEQRLDALTYPTSNLPGVTLGAPVEPLINNNGGFAQQEPGRCWGLRASRRSRFPRASPQKHTTVFSTAPRRTECAWSGRSPRNCPWASIF